MVRLDALLDSPVAFLATSLKYEGPRVTRPRQVSVLPLPVSRASDEQVASMEDVDNLEDALDDLEESEGSEDEDEVDLNWKEGQVEVDVRATDPDHAFKGKASLRLPSREYANPAKYFLRFLPETHIREVVITAINEHASEVLPTFQHVTYEEYLIWIALFLLVIIRTDCHEAHWIQGNLAHLLAINFADYMSLDRFNTLTKMHIFARPDAQL
jgi:hypothetical protein